MQILAAFFDLGDVIMQETTQVVDADEATISADLVPGMDTVLRDLYARGVKLAIVADTHRKNPANVLGQHRLLELFAAFAISDDLGCEKPDPRIFQFALDKLNIPPHDYDRVVMVGNNLRRDVRGANALGLRSIWFHWNDRYPIVPRDALEQPTYTVHTAAELQSLLEILSCDANSHAEE